MKRGDMPAQPVTLQAGEAWSEDVPCADGMTIRERMAMAAMQGLCEDPAMSGPASAARLAVECADALLAELERAGGGNE